MHVVCSKKTKSFIHSFIHFDACPKVELQGSIKKDVNHPLTESLMSALSAISPESIQYKFRDFIQNNTFQPDCGAKEKSQGLLK